MQISITVPDRIGASCREFAKSEYDMELPDFLKYMLFTACHTKEGFFLKIDLAALPPSGLPLLEAAGVSVEETTPAAK